MGGGRGGEWERGGVGGEHTLCPLVLLHMQLPVRRPVLLQAVRGAVIALPLLVGRLCMACADGALEGGLPVLVDPTDQATPVYLTPVPPAMRTQLASVSL